MPTLTPIHPCDCEIGCPVTHLPSRAGLLGRLGCVTCWPRSQSTAVRLLTTAPGRSPSFPPQCSLRLRPSCCTTFLGLAFETTSGPFQVLRPLHRSLIVESSLANHEHQLRSQTELMAQHLLMTAAVLAYILCASVSSSRL